MAISEHVKERMMKVAEMRLRGKRPYQIARILGVSAMTITQDIKKITREYMKVADEEKDCREAQVKQKELQYEEIIQQAYEEWERSKLDRRKQVEEYGKNENSPEMQQLRLTITEEGRTADAAYLRIVTDALKAICALRGLNAPTEIKGQMNNLNVNVDWSVIGNIEAMEQLKKNGVPDEVEQRINRALAPPSLPLPLIESLTAQDVNIITAEESDAHPLDNIPDSEFE
jgi:hypothetical protein